MCVCVCVCVYYILPLHYKSQMQLLKFILVLMVTSACVPAAVPESHPATHRANKRKYLPKIYLTPTQHAAKLLEIAGQYGIKNEKATNLKRTRRHCVWAKNPYTCDFQYRYHFDDERGMWVWEQSGEHTCAIRRPPPAVEYDPSGNSSSVLALSTDVKRIIWSVIDDRETPSMTPDQLRFYLMGAPHHLDASQIPLGLVQGCVYRKRRKEQNCSGLPHHTCGATIKTWCRKYHCLLESDRKKVGWHDLIVLTDPASCFESNGEIRLVFTTKFLLYQAVLAALTKNTAICCDHKHTFCSEGIPLFVVGIIDHLQRFTPLAFQLAHRTNAPSLKSCFSEIKRWALLRTTLPSTALHYTTPAH